MSIDRRVNAHARQLAEAGTWGRGEGSGRAPAGKSDLVSGYVKRLRNKLRSFLARRKIAVTRMDGALPRPLNSYLDELTKHEPAFDRIFVFDSDPETLNAFYERFPGEKLHFESDPDLAHFKFAFNTSGKLLFACDIMLLMLKPGSPLLEGIAFSEVIIIRSKLGHFWSGEIDIYDVCEQVCGAGFEMSDVLQNELCNRISSAGANVFLVFERKKDAKPKVGEKSGARLYRISEALTSLGTPIALECGHKQMLGWGSYRFAAGVMNPGIVRETEPLQILARGERVPWPVQKRNNSHSAFLTASQPMLFTLDRDLEIQEMKEVNFSNQKEYPLSRFEDFRFFRFGGRIYASHVIMQCEREGFDRTPVRPQSLRTSMGVSLFEPETHSFMHLGTISVERPVSRIEKNWAVFVQDGRVYLIYSFHPYRLFAADSPEGLHFRGVMERELLVPEDGLAFRNSINPIEYDDLHYLHIVHKAFPGKRYVFWAVLIDRQSLLPVKISRRPLISNRASGWKTMVYVCSAMVREDELLVFGGIDDCSIGIWRVPRAVIDYEWTSIV